MSGFAYYVYYRIRPEVAANARERVRSAQAELAAARGVCARLLVKRGEPELWMEVYDGVSDTLAFEQALAAAVERHHLLDALRPGTARHVECFGEPRCA
jgi:hypothetical protein